MRACLAFCVEGLQGLGFSETSKSPNIREHTFDFTGTLIRFKVHSLESLGLGFGVQPFLLGVGATSYEVF